MRYVVLFVVILFVVISCGQTKRELKVLDLAESLIYSDVDSACNLLSTLSLNSIRGEKAKARYALLYSKSLDKNYVDIAHDSLASFAVSYYSLHGDSIEKSTAYYYLSKVLANKRDLELSIKNLTLAEEFVPSDSYELKGLIHNAFGRKYRDQSSYEKSLKHFKLSAEAFEFFDKDIRHGRALFIMGWSMHNLKKYNDELRVYGEALDIFEALNDTTLIYGVHRNIAIAKMRMKIPISHIKSGLLDVYDKYNDGEVYDGDYRLWSLLYTEESNIDSARYYFFKFKHKNFSKTHVPENRVKLLGYIRMIEKKAGNYKKAVEYGDSIRYFMDSIHRVDRNKIIQDLNEKYKNELHEDKLIYLEDKLKYQIILFIVLIILGAFIFYIVHKQRIGQREKKLILKQEEIDFIEKARSLLRKNYNEEVHNNEIKNKEIFKQQEILAAMEEAGRTLKSYYEGVIELTSIKALEYETTSRHSLNEMLAKITELNEKYVKYENAPKEFFKVFSDTMNISSNLETKQLMYSLVNIQYNNILTYLEHKYKLAPRELDLCCMICMGYSNSCINALLGFTNKLTIYNYRSILRYKLNLKSEKIDLFDYFNELKKMLSSK